VRLAWEDAVARGTKSPNDPKHPGGATNNFGASAGGPVRIPGLYNGRVIASWNNTVDHRSIACITASSKILLLPPLEVTSNPAQWIE